MAAQRGVQHASGVWVGQALGGARARNTLWTLTLIADAPAPSAYGASVERDGSVLILHGDWSAASRSLRLVERGRNVHRVFVATLQEDAAGLLSLQGTWLDSGTKEGGQFACCKEPDNAGTYISGLWLGQAAPDASLADFLIPTNPIRWSLALLLQAPGGVPSVFGGGYFDDSGDVPGRPHLYFTLSGDWDPEARRLRFVKEYEAAAETEGYEVHYEATLEREASAPRTGESGGETLWLRGAWRNEKGGSFGQFAARRQQAFEAAVAAICLCEVCGQPIKPGELRWTCATCLSFWCCCATCAQVDGVHEHALTPEAVFEQATGRGACCAQLAADALVRFARRPFLGTRAPPAPAFAFCTYGDVAALAFDVLCALRAAGCPPRARALFAAPLTPAYAAAMLGAHMAGCVLVPVHAALEPAALAHVVERTCPAVLFVAAEGAAAAAAAVASAKVSPPPAFVLLPSHVAPLPAYAPAAPGAAPPRPAPGTPVELTALAAFGARERRGRTSAAELGVQRVQLSEVCAVLYTSGSTGVPKGVVFTEELCMPSEGVATVQPFIRLDFQAFDPSFFLSLLQTMLCGGQRLLAASLATLMDDFRIGRPTHIGATPVLWNSLYRQYVADVAAAAAAQQTLPPAQRKSRAAIEQQVADALRRQLGNRLKVASSGGAAISPEVLHFARSVLRIDIVDLYGSRETGGIARDGVVYKGVDVRLLSIPELGYHADGHPPRGEICVNSPRMVSGYWRDLKATEAAFVTLDGKQYYRTGDVGEWRTERGALRLRVIDRCGALVKLAHGEWVSPARIETTLEECPAVAQALVAGSPSHAFTVAVVVPSRLAAAFWAAPHDPAVRARTAAETLAAMRLWCTSQHVRPIEIPQRVHLESEAWTAEGGLVTATEKKRRGPLLARYRPVIDALFAANDDAAAAAAAPAPQAAALSAEFVALLQRALPAVAAPPPESTLGELGCDSLGAAVLFKALQEAGVALPDLRALFDFSLAHLSALHAHAASHAPTPLRNCAAEIDWAAEAALPADLADLDAPPADARPHRDALLTGATGFLGPLLLREVAARLPPGARLYCLVRGASQADAEARLQRDLQRAGVALPAGVELCVLRGDLARPALGLAEEAHARLLRDVGAVYHSGARVNMALPYAALRPANVGGTLEVLRLAARANARLHFVSSVGALGTSVPAAEDLTSYGGLSAQQLEEKDGYGQSKAVAESLLRAAARRLPWLDIRVYRPATIASDSASGFFNEQDFTVLLLKAAVQLKCAVNPRTTLLHWLPVDFVARAIATLAAAPRNPSACVFHLTAEGPSVHAVVEALKAAGAPLENVPPEEWRKRVATRITEAERLLYPVRELLRSFDWAAPKPAALPTEGTRAALKAAGGEWVEMSPDALARFAGRCLGAK